jgi:hypothetical protein
VKKAERGDGFGKIPLSKRINGKVEVDIVIYE